MLRIVIKASEVHARTVNSKGREITFRDQDCWLHTPEGEVRKIRVPLNRDQSAYAPGNYTLSDDSFRVNDYGDLAIGRLVLMPIAQGTTAGKAA
jgi:hypothetical protein